MGASREPLLAHLLEQMNPQPNSLRAAPVPLHPGQCPGGSCDPLGSPILMHLPVSWGGRGEQEPLSTRQPPRAPTVADTGSSAHSPATDRQQRPHRPGPGGAACVPALHRPGWAAPPGKALAQGWPARECWAPLGAVGRGTWGRRGCHSHASVSAWLFPLLGVSSSFCPLFGPISEPSLIMH